MKTKNELFKFNTDYPKIFRNIIDTTVQYINNNKIEALVLGMSGGIDSTLTAALASEVIKGTDEKVKLIGEVINVESKETEIARGLIAAESFCNIYNSIDLTDTLNNFVGKSPQALLTASKLRRGNIKARLRMIRLYDTARANHGIVLSTDNYTELLLGFWTLHGDVGDYGMLQNLWKTEVYGLAEYMRTNIYQIKTEIKKHITLLSAITAVPTDGLGVSNNDFEQLNPKYDKSLSPEESYRVIDERLQKYLYGDGGGKEDAIIGRYEATHFKRNNPYNIPRELIIRQ